MAGSGIRVTKQKWVSGGRRSLPWSKDEYLYVDGLPCTYSGKGHGAIVHLPGGKHIPLTLLRETHKVEEPKRWRSGPFA